nr:uncharacterized protein LOC113820736 [Penaeus vannamei]
MATGSLHVTRVCINNPSSNWHCKSLSQILRRKASLPCSVCSQPDRKACLLLATACYTARGSATTPLRRPQEEEHTISMGRVVYFLIATLLLVSRTEAAVFDGLLTCHRICPAVLRPVCGSDGRTYDNSCQLQEARCSDPSLEEVHPGPCPGAEALLL